jgi:hypothetical protein
MADAHILPAIRGRRCQARRGATVPSGARSAPRRPRTRIEKFQANEQNLIVVVNCLSDRLKIATELIGRLTGKSVDDVKK